MISPPSHYLKVASSVLLDKFRIMFFFLTCWDLAHLYLANIFQLEFEGNFAHTEKVIIRSVRAQNFPKN